LIEKTSGSTCSKSTKSVCRFEWVDSMRTSPKSHPSSQHNDRPPLESKPFTIWSAGTIPRVRFRPPFFVFDWTEIAGTKLPEISFSSSRGGINRHWNVNQPKLMLAFPDGRIRECFPKRALPVRTLTDPPRQLVCLGEIPCNSENVDVQLK